MIVGMLILLIALAVLALVGVWLFLTWYHADNGRMFGPAEPNRVTFLMVLQGVFRDVRVLLKLDLAARWVVTNAIALAVALDAVVTLADPRLREAILNATWNGLPLGAIGLLGVTLLVRIKAASPAAA